MDLFKKGNFETNTGNFLTLSGSGLD